MSNSEINIETLVSTAEAALQGRGENIDAPPFDEILANIKSAMSKSKDARKALGPLIANLRKAQSATRATLINWVPARQGHLAIGHRPRIKTIKTMPNLGVTHVLTLLSESEGAQSIGSEARRGGLDWIWLPLISADPPSEARRAAIIQTFDAVCTALSAHARIYIHCSAGIHRTGMITYALLRHAKFSAEDAMIMLSKLRQKTADDIGDTRKQWGEQFA